MLCFRTASPWRWNSSQGWLTILTLSFFAWTLGQVVHSTEDLESSQRMKADLEYLASDALEGRGVETEGLQRASEFIANRWKELGLRTELFAGGPFQDFEINGPRNIADPSKNSLVLQGPQGEVIRLELGQEFIATSLGSNGTFSGPIAFTGYGITAKSPEMSLNYDDYASLDVRGKVVIVIRKEPQQDLATSPFAGKDPSEHAFFSTKENNATSHGAAAMLLVNDMVTASNLKTWSTETRQRLLSDLEAIVAFREPLAQLGADPKAQRKWMDDYSAKIAETLKGVDLMRDQGDALPSVDGVGRSSGRKRIPTLYVKRAMVDRLLAPSGITLDEIERKIDQDLQPRSMALEGWKASGQTEIKESRIPVRNVMAVLPGRGALAEEYVVIGAHYDHVGMGGVGSLAPGTIAVHNGADDNASGTTMLLELSRRLTAALSTESSRRTLVFIAFSAEESGLLGSAHYVRNPRFPLEKTVAMVNMDMVGRLTDNALTVYGTGTAKSFDAMIDELNQRYQFDLEKSPEGLGPSDHASFFEKQIPVFHFFTGLHNDYHRPSDDFDKINVTGMVRITDMVFDVASKLVMDPERPVFVPVKGRANPMLSSGRRARLQITLRSGVPVVIESLEAGGAAEKAGLLVGDRLVRLDDKPIDSAEDVVTVLSARKPGDQIDVEVVRGEERKKFVLRLAR